MENNFYLYEHKNPKTGEVFYIGIGSGRRAYDKYRRSRFWKNYVNKHDFVVCIVFDGLSWENACSLEMELIAKYGRRDLGRGPLLNMTDGGDGSTGPKSEEHKRKIAIANIGHSVSEYTRKKLSLKNKGNKNASGCKRSKETREKNRQGRRSYKNKPIVQYDIDGNFLKEWEDLYSIVKELRLTNHGVYVIKSCKYDPRTKTFLNCIWRFKSDECRSKIEPVTRNTTAGYKHSEDVKEKIKKASTGRRKTEETKEKIKKSVSGKNNGMFGKKHSIATLEKMSIAHRKII